MKRLFRFAIAFAVALVFVPFLPLYVERTMTHVMFAHGGGGAIDWGWKICSLGSYWSNYRYFRSQQHPALWLTLNIALACTYAVVIALSIDQLLARGKHSYPSNL